MYLERISLADSVALVAGGGGGGIGTAISCALVEAGAHVILLDRTAKDAEPTFSAIPNEDRLRVSFVALDLFDYGRFSDLMEYVLREQGQLNILVNVVGRSIQERKPFFEYTSDEWSSVYTRNLEYVFALCRAAAPLLTSTATQNASILNVSSSLARRPRAGSSAYSCFKAGLEQLTRSLAVELGPRGVRANAIAVGSAATPFVLRRETSVEDYDEGFRSWLPLGRGGRPEDIAAAALFLSSNLASYITGQVLAVDGGMSVMPPGPMADLL
jgi:NAD(P)-dependent dehydrogenase (short-subunit alcohol dehydrogenase family)